MKSRVKTITIPSKLEATQYTVPNIIGSSRYQYPVSISVHSEKPYSVFNKQTTTMTIKTIMYVVIKANSILCCVSL